MTLYDELMKVLCWALCETKESLESRVVRVSAGGSMLERRLDAELIWLTRQAPGSEEVEACEAIVALGRRMRSEESKCSGSDADRAGLRRAQVIFGALVQEVLSRLGTCNTEVIRRARIGRKNRKGLDAANVEKKANEKRDLITETIISYFRDHPGHKDIEAAHFLVREASPKVCGVFARLRNPIDAARKRVNRLRKKGMVGQKKASRKGSAAVEGRIPDVYEFRWSFQEDRRGPTGFLSAILWEAQSKSF